MKIIFNGVDITKKKYKDASGKTVKLDIDGLRQKMGMVFQHFNLFPHMTILDNMTLAPMKVRGVSKEEAEKKHSGASGTCRACGSCKCISDPALRWTETACCDRKSTCDGTGSDAL